MAGEETGINEALAKAGIERLETDLGEYIIQLADEPPSHIIAPAIHKTKTKSPNSSTSITQSTVKLNGSRTLRRSLMRREVLRQGFLSADAGITGGNFPVAETGTVALVTNEGNGDLTNTLPDVHIVTAGMKVIPTLEDLSTMLRLLAKCDWPRDVRVHDDDDGPKRPNDQDGPMSTMLYL